MHIRNTAGRRVKQGEGINDVVTGVGNLLLSPFRLIGNVVGKLFGRKGGKMTYGGSRPYGGRMPYGGRRRKAKGLPYGGRRHRK
jgi:hypothetical protein